MVLTLPIKKITSITLDMLKLTCPKWQGGFFYPYPNLVFLLEFPIWKTKNFDNELRLQKHCKHFEKLGQAL